MNCRDTSFPLNVRQTEDGRQAAAGCRPQVQDTTSFLYIGSIDEFPGGEREAGGKQVREQTVVLVTGALNIYVHNLYMAAVGGLSVYKGLA